jgi:2-dehydro-3-deoxyphosphogluconate aldolase/(4S)-4-hydroxy-2-oxoglutarate aldolase
VVSDGFDVLLLESRLVAIVRGERAAPAVDVLFSAGVRLVEVSLTSRDALDVVARVTPPSGCLLGVGTVRTAADVAAAVAAGAGFVVSPALNPAVPAAVAAGVPVLGGALTPSEVETALELGVTAVKLFPASLGGPDYLAALRQPFPDVPFVPVGGVGLADVPAYLAAGAVAVGIGSPLVRDAADGGDLRALAERARRLVAG